jgi:hypothetical protein
MYGSELGLVKNGQKIARPLTFARDVDTVRLQIAKNNSLFAF